MLNKQHRKERYLNIVKVMYYKATANINFNNENLKHFPLRKPETPQKCSFPPPLLNFVPELLIRPISIYPKESIQIGKKQNYPSLQRS